MNKNEYPLGGQTITTVLVSRVGLTYSTGRSIDIEIET